MQIESQTKIVVVKEEDGTLMNLENMFSQTIMTKACVPKKLPGWSMNSDDLGTLLFYKSLDMLVERWITRFSQFGLYLPNQALIMSYHNRNYALNLP